MGDQNHEIKQLQEKMRILLQLITDGKLSNGKKIELEIEYCFLQDKFEKLKQKQLTQE